jgi:hypothetical protein
MLEALVSEHTQRAKQDELSRKPRRRRRPSP